MNITRTTLALYVVTLFVGCCPRVSMIDIGPLTRERAIDCLATAHRGSLHTVGHSWDNSLPALAAAAKAGVPLLEVDVRLSDEGELFLFHDGSVDSGNAEHAPKDLLGRRIQSVTGDQRKRVFLDKERTIGIPRLEEALSAIANTQSALELDLKAESDLVTFETLKVLANMRALPRVVLQLRSPDRAGEVKNLYPDARIISRCLSMEQLEVAIGNKVEFVELERWITSEAVRTAHEHGIKVLINVASSRLDEPRTWEYLRSRGVDVIMSDFADKHRCPQQPG